MENHLSGFLNSRSCAATTRARVGVSSGRIATSRSPLSVKLKSCVDDLRAALFLVKIGRLQDWAVPFHKAIAARDFAPAREDVIPRGAIVRQEITKTGKRLHRMKLHLLQGAERRCNRAGCKLRNEVAVE